MSMMCRLTVVYAQSVEQHLMMMHMTGRKIVTNVPAVAKQGKIDTPG
jgi:hypothetical protein